MEVCGGSVAMAVQSPAVVAYGAVGDPGPSRQQVVIVGVLPRPNGRTC